MAIVERVVWIIDSEQWPRALLRAELIERGYDAVGFITVSDAIDQLPWRKPNVIVVELRGQPIQHLERLLKLNVPVILTGGVPEINDAELRSLPFAAVMRRPVSLGDIADHVASVIS
jgi:DNA-binding NtrC family response regulator